MSMDLPQCNLKTCRYSSDGNCTDKNRFGTCEYSCVKQENTKLKVENERLKELMPKMCETCEYEDEIGYEEPCNSCNNRKNWKLLGVGT